MNIKGKLIMKKKVMFLLVACVLAATMVCIGVVMFVANKADTGALSGEKTPLLELSDEELLSIVEPYELLDVNGSDEPVKIIRTWIGLIEKLDFDAHTENVFLSSTSMTSKSIYLSFKQIIDDYYNSAECIA